MKHSTVIRTALITIHAAILACCLSSQAKAAPITIANDQLQAEFGPPEIPIALNVLAAEMQECSVGRNGSSFAKYKVLPRNSNSPPTDPGRNPSNHVS